MATSNFAVHITYQHAPHYPQQTTHYLVTGESAALAATLLLGKAGFMDPNKPYVLVNVAIDKLYTVEGAKN